MNRSIPTSAPGSAQQQQPQSITQKYREVIIAILVFIVLDVGVLVLNFIISFQIQDDAIAVNLAGRQRMLSQRNTKALYQLQANLAEGKDPTKPLEELKIASELFDSTLRAFISGGEAKGGDGKTVTLHRTDNPKANSALQKTLELWTPFKQKIDEVLKSSGNPNPEVVAGAIAVAAANNLQVLQFMNEFTTSLETIAKQKATTLRTIQSVALVLVLINFLVIIVHVIGKLKRSDAAVAEFSEHLTSANSELQQANTQLEALTGQLSAAKQESDTIFGAVRQGLCLLDRDLRVGSQISEELKNIFQNTDLEGCNFQHLLKPILSEKQYQTVQDFFSLLLDPNRRDKQLVKFNPLKRVECNFSRGEQGFTVKHLEFAFQRIYSGSEIERILVTVADATERVNLESRLKTAEEKKERQFELLMGILHVPAESLTGFMRQCSTELKTINAILRENAENEGDERARMKLDPIFRSVHNIKGNAGFLGLKLFEDLAHRMEEKLSELRRLPKVSGKDFLPIVVDLAELQNTAEELSEVVLKLTDLRKATVGTEIAPIPTATQQPASVELASSMRSLGNALASKLQKQVQVECRLTHFDELHEAHRVVVKDTLIQLLRNSVAHGIETPRERRESGKAEVGRIEVRTERMVNGASHFILTYRDDGRGLHPEKIRERIVQHGILPEPEARALSVEELCGYIFEPGFSTADHTTTEAGRGVGLDVIKNKVVDELGGEIEINFMPEQFCEFTISLPA